MTTMTYREGYNKVWESFSTLRMTSSGVGELFIFLLHARRFRLFRDSAIDELRFEVSHGQVRPESLYMLLDIASHEIRERNEPISPAFLEDVQHILRVHCLSSSGETLAVCGALFSLYSIEDSWFEDHYAAVFDELLPRIFAGDYMSAGEFSTPEELTQLVQRLSEGLDVQSIYNPFAGTCSFSSIATNGATYFGQEINERIATLGVLRMYAHGQNPNNVICEDSTLHWSPGNRRFDLIVSFPPLGMRVPNTAEMMIDWKAQSISMEDFYILKGCKSLNRGGKLIGILSNSFLFSGGGTGALRKRLVDDGRIETVIQLPVGLLRYTGTAICLLIINDGYQKNTSVRFIDASSFFKKEGRRNHLQVDSIIQSIQFFDARVSAKVSLEEIRANDYKLVPSAYVEGEERKELVIPEGFEAVQLKDIVTGYRAVVSTSETARIVRGRDLLFEHDGIGTGFDKLQPEPLEGKRFGRLDRDVILVQKVRFLKPTLFFYRDGVEVVVSSNVVPLIPNEGIDPYYLVSELRKEYVASQVDRLIPGAYIPSLKIGDILSLKILLPIDRSLQRSAYLSGERLARESQLKASQLDERIQRERERIKEMMKIRRHRIKPYISGLKDCVSMMLDKLYDGDINGALELSEGYNLQLALEDMQTNLGDLETLFALFTADTNIGEAESIDLVVFLKQYTFTQTIPGRHFELKKDFSEFKGVLPKILFNKDNLKEVLDEIIHNAEKHLILDNKESKVVLIPRVEGTAISLLICNNGNPVPPDFDEERSFVAGYHKDEDGTGLGLSRVRQLCDEFGAKIRWENEVNSAMPVGLRITFSIGKD